MRHTTYFFILSLFLSVATVFAQQRNVSVLHDSQLYNYTVIRYSPAWEIQSESAQPVQLADHAKLFRKVEDDNVGKLKSLLYAKGFVPSELNGVSGSSMESYLASKRLVMHYRIQFKGHTIFIAHLNNSTARSVIPFKIEGAKWILDPSFAETEFFNLIAQPYFNIYTGGFEGMAYSYLGFEEVDKDGVIYDYSGHGNHGWVNKESIDDGRIGGAFKIVPETDMKIDLGRETNLKGDRFTIDGHLKISQSFLNDDKARLLMTAENANGVSLQVSYQDDELSLFVLGGKRISVPMPAFDTWFRFTVKQAGTKLSFEINGEEVAANTTNGRDVLHQATLKLGGKESFRGYVDELRIAK